MLKDKVIKTLLEVYGDDTEHQAIASHAADRIVEEVNEWLIPQISEAVAKAYRVFLDQ